MANQGYAPPPDSIASRTRSRTAAARAAAEAAATLAAAQAAAAAVAAAEEQEEWVGVVHQGTPVGDPPANPENAQAAQQQHLGPADVGGEIGHVEPPISDTDTDDSIATRMARDARRGYPYARGGGVA
ncbi:uncharacterized protein LOC121052194 [Rosa chinensis]|uniref:uncharacterized protein LOC121052193 n=1 Tax=Rosa chinensis TaxID=74649 RepID=UPI001AD92ED2|nr:uncharacterized protein LOC121052193 [Rosa chinensis]XP_040372450.1 uncharacterized protein LOC121052194 [Rosa chinensis]